MTTKDPRLAEKLAVLCKVKSIDENPCEGPCDSFGICDGCTDALMYRAGFRACGDLLAPLLEQMKEALEESHKFLKQRRLYAKSNAGRIEAMNDEVLAAYELFLEGVK